MKLHDDEGPLDKAAIGVLCGRLDWLVQAGDYDGLRRLFLQAGYPEPLTNLLIRLLEEEADVNALAPGWERAAVIKGLMEFVDALRRQRSAKRN